jgi:hypothetical protein
MRYIKTYENLDEPQVGDYVILNVDENDKYSILPQTNQMLNPEFAKKLFDHLMNHIGIISNIYYYNTNSYLIKFINTPFYGAYPLYFTVARDQIKSFSKSKKQLELQLSVKKYNI